MYFKGGLRSEQDIECRSDLAPYWSPKYERRLFEYNITNHRHAIHYYNVRKHKARCQFTGRLIDQSGNLKSVYGHDVYAQRSTLLRLGFVWIDNLNTYIHESEPITTQRALNSDGMRTNIAPEINDYEGSYGYVWGDIEEIYISEYIVRDHPFEDCEAISNRYFEERFFECDSCCEVRYASERAYNDVCEFCDHEESEPCLSPYDACALSEFGFYNGKGRATSKPIRRGARYVGVEIELELESTSQVNELREEIESKRLALGCHDGSLNCSVGIEVITQPLLMGAPMRKRLKEVYQCISKHDLCLRDGVGIHVSVSRASVSNLTIGKAQVFLHNPHNAEFVEMIAGRRSDRWASFQTYKDLKSDVGFKKKYYTSDRYTALNIKDSVVEFRIFASTGKYETCLRHVEFCDALLNFCQSVPMSEAHRRNIKHEDFKLWLEKRRSIYPELSKAILPKIDKNQKTLDV
jgi:hypothetical protein